MTTDFDVDPTEPTTTGTDPTDKVHVVTDEIPLTDPVIETPDASEWGEDESPYDDDLDTQDPGADEGATPRRTTLLAPSVRSGADAVRWALDHSSWSPAGMCQQFTRSAFNVGSYYGSAAAAWNGARHKHPTTNPFSIPRGVPVFWLGGSRGYGHAAVSLGNGMVRTTDWPYATRVGTARISDIWSSQRLVGWTEDINTVRVWEPPSEPLVLAGRTAHAARAHAELGAGKLLKRAVTAEVGRGRMNLDSAVLGNAFRTQYALVQRKYLRAAGVTRIPADAADGIPGVSSLTWLGHRRGFTVG